MSFPALHSSLNSATLPHLQISRSVSILQHKDGLTSNEFHLITSYHNFGFLQDKLFTCVFGGALRAGPDQRSLFAVEKALALRRKRPLMLLCRR